MKSIMKIYIILFAFLAVMAASPAFASFNISAVYDTAPVFVNTRDNTTFLNITLAANHTIANLSGMNFTITGDANASDIRIIRVINTSNGAVLGQNSTFNTPRIIFVNFSSPLVVSAGSHFNISIMLELLGNATKSRIGINISSAADFISNVSVVNRTVFPVNSTIATIVDVHSNATVSPRIVDTNVSNQTFIINITPLGTNVIKNITIVFPDGYNITNVTSVKQSDSELLWTSSRTIDAPPAFRDNVLFINKTGINVFTPTGDILINVSINTNASAISSKQVLITMSGNNITNVPVDVFANNMNVTTTPLVTIMNTSVVKGAALINGTDFWEFSITVNITQTVTGTLQLRMTNWSGTSGLSIALTNQTNPSGAEFYASLRNQSQVSGSGSFNITNDYNITKGLQYSAGPTSPITVLLRMVIPIGTQVSNSWQTTFNTLFRVTP